MIEISYPKCLVDLKHLKHKQTVSVLPHIQPVFPTNTHNNTKRGLALHLCRRLNDIRISLSASSAPELRNGTKSPQQAIPANKQNHPHLQLALQLLHHIKNTHTQFCTTPKSPHGLLHHHKHSCSRSVRAHNCSTEG